MSENKDIIRGGQFIVRETNAEDIFTPEDFSEEQKMMRDSVQEFVDKEIMPIKPRFEEGDYALTEEIMRKAGELGLLGVTVPEQYDGLGMDFTTSMLVCDYISGATGSIATAYGAHTGIGTMPISLYGNDEQKQKYLPKLATGEWFGAYCLTEPEAGSDANSGKTTASLSDDGKYYSISGQKMWISNAGFANVMIVFARIEDDKNITGFIVDYDPENGITLGEEENKLGIKSSSTRMVFFSDCKVPVENMLSDRGNGFKIAMNVLNIGRIKLAAACLDAQRRVLNLSTEYAKERKQFNTPIAEFGAIKYKLAEMATEAYVSESGSYRAAQDIQNRIDIRLAGGEAREDAELKGVEEFAIECSILKVAASEYMQNSSDEGIQIYGGMGFSADAPMESAWRDARISRIYEGTNEINRMLTIGMLLRKAMKGHVNILEPAMKVAEELTSIPSFDTPDYSAYLAEEKAILANLKKVFLMVAGAAVQKYGEALEEHQQLLLSASDILIDIYMAESAILRTEKNAKRYGEDSQKIQLAMTKLFLYRTVENITKNAKEGIVSFAEGDEQRMMLMGLRRFTRYQEYPVITDLRTQIANHVIAKDGYHF